MESYILRRNSPLSDDPFAWEEELEGDELEVDEFELEIDEPEPPGLPFEGSTEPSEYEWSQANATRYYNLFKATLEELKKASFAILEECVDLASMQGREMDDRTPINSRWVVKFTHSEPDILTRHALHDVPSKTWSILGDPDLNRENCVAKLRNLPEISKGAHEVHVGEYLDIVERLWHTTSPDGRHVAGEIETKIYHGATCSKVPGYRIREHKRHLRKPLSVTQAAFTKINVAIPYHYQFGCQGDSSEDGPAYECRSDFRSLGHISDNKDPSETTWPWLREMVNQIILNLLPGPESTFRCRTLTTKTKELV